METMKLNELMEYLHERESTQTYVYQNVCYMGIVLSRIVGNLTIVCAFDAYPFRIRLLKIGGPAKTVEQQAIQQSK